MNVVQTLNKCRDDFFFQEKAVKLVHAEISFFGFDF